MWILYVLNQYGVRPKGVVHLGAHLAEEQVIYSHLGIPDKNILWVEANPELCDMMRAKLPEGSKIVNAAVADCRKEVTFHVTNNSVSSSMLPLGTHATCHPQVVYVRDLHVSAYTLPEIMESNSCDPADYDLLVMDLQGAEGLALLGMGEFVKNFRHVILEFCETEQYVGATTWEPLKKELEDRGFRFVERRVFPDGAGDALFSLVL